VRAGSFAGQPSSSARGLELHLETRRLVREVGDGGFAELIPYRNARVAISQTLDTQPGQPLMPGLVTLGCSQWPAEAVAVLSRCDNQRSVGDVADGDLERVSLIRRLALEGVLFMRLPADDHTRNHR
jgi:hypothetical protein